MTNTKKQNIEEMSVQEQLQELERQLNGKYINRRDIVRSLIVTLLANGNMVMLGPAGTAKTDIVQTLSKCINSKYFETLLTRLSPPEELFGPISIKELEEGRFARVTENSLATADIGFIDECFKGSSETLNSMLGVLAQRVFRNGTASPEQIPLTLTVGASNEMPEGGAEGDLAALWDRFEVRHITEYIKDDRSFLQLLTMDSSCEPNIRIALDDVKFAQKASRQVDVSPILPNLVKLWKDLRQANISVSDRKFRNCLKYLKANAYLDGRYECEPADIAFLANMFWDTPDKIKEVRKIVMKANSDDMAKAQDIFDSASDLYNELVMLPSNDESIKEKYGKSKSQVITEYHGKITKAKAQLETIQHKLQKAGKNTRIVDGWLEDTNRMFIAVCQYLTNVNTTLGTI